MSRNEHAEEIRRALSDPGKLCEALGLLEGSRRQAGGMIVCCPAHGERNPSCSVTLGPDGTVRVKCFACELAGDAFALIAAAYRLDARGQFREVLEAGAEIAGLHDAAGELRDGRPRNESRPMPRRAEPRTEPDYPPAAEVKQLWTDTIPVIEDQDAAGLLLGRRIDPQVVAKLDLARALRPDTHHSRLPGWARYRGNQEVSRAWTQTGHRMLVGAYDHTGELRSVRAWLVTDDPEMPKRIPPAGCRASGLVLANRAAQLLLAGKLGPTTLHVCEGEPDFLTWSTRSYDAVIGILSGSWSEQFAARIPLGSEVHIRTHHDPAGDKYAEEVIKSLSKRCECWRNAAAA